MKKKLLCGSLVFVALIWAVTGVDPLRFMIEFVAAGSLPGMTVSLSPTLMLVLALGGGTLLLYKIWAFQLPAAKKEIAAAEKMLAAKSRRRFARVVAK